ncbi:MAG: hypothetical protein WCC59_01700, partial [Terriglobales bacterium]
HHSEGLQIWNDGWDHRRRPSLQKMMEYLNDRLLEGKVASMKGFTAGYNSATHGDPLSARWNVVLRQGLPVFLVSKNLASPALADEICAEAIPWLAATMGMMSAAFGEGESAGGAII